MPKVDPVQQRDFAVAVVKRLVEHGRIAYWAGGCVRDQLLGRQPKDYDVATDAAPDAIRRIFGKNRTLAIGAAFGVITVLGPKEAGQIEVATFRQDLGYTDGRRPDAVVFSSPAEDAKRRDFTINGMFYDPLTDQVIDFVGGREDLREGIVRAIGDPRERIAEDKLRMLRAVRFAATFDFSIAADTLEAIQAMASELPVVSAERIADEMRRMLTHSNRSRAIELLAQAGLLGVVLPEFPPLDHPKARRTLEVLRHLEHPSFALALAGLLHEWGTGETVAEIGQRWKLSNREVHGAGWLVEHSRALEGAVRQPWSRLQPVLIADGAEELIQLHEARAQAGLTDQRDGEYARARLALPPDQLNPQPLITGGDLIRHGVPRGKVYALLLDRVRQAQLDGEIATREEALRYVDAVLAEGVGREDGNAD